jgi:hypothetical protein
VVDLSEQDPNTVASLLKLYLRELPEPLIPHSSLSGRIDNIFGELFSLNEIVMDPILAMWHAVCCAHPIASLSDML